MNIRTNSKSNYQTKFSHRIIALFFLFTFINTLVPYNQLWANNNGPNAPEAAAFEPVDATDMVNLSTGDLSYVMPLLNVPSPEGGYPLALSYHAGIAMDQEASWVGLGWSLNPGAINRSVNGYPDDWGKTRVTEFFYDQGETKEQYSFSIGGTLPNGLTLGMSAAWGDYRAWGGIVGYAGVRANFGSEGIGLGVGIPGTGIYTSINSTKEGVSVGVGAGSSYGIASISGYYNISTGKFSAQAGMKWLGMGISLDSSGSLNSSSSISQVSNKQTNLSKNDYYITDIDKGFNFDVGLYWVSYRHRKYSYSLFKNTDLFVSGTLNLYENSKNDNGSYTRNYMNFMDVKQFAAEDRNTEIGFLPANRYKNGMFSMPNYDNYSVTAQGISGRIAPEFFDDIRLYSKGYRKEQNGINDHRNKYKEWGDYLTNFNGNEAARYKLNDKISFYFKGKNSSFLRTQTGNFNNPYGTTYPTNISDEQILNSIDTQVDDTYNSNTTQNGYQKTRGNRKRTGNYVETFTNEDIVNNETNGWFIAPNNFDRNFNDLIKKPMNGIGAYRITTTDGKTYHYSLPVYHFESFYKNFNDKAKENTTFFESKKTEPYATHWLLTAVTGPDYVDNNNNGKVDEADYGYWVEFDYGKWSDGYGWRSPKIGFKELDENQTYFWGVKQIYYLDHIKTRTHTALFVKSIRNDNYSSEFKHYKTKYAGGNLHDYSKKIKSKEFKTHPYTEKLYTKSGNIYSGNGTHINGLKASWKYIDIPINKTLKLDKIILLKNKDVLYDKNVSQSIYGQYRKTGFSYYNEGYFHPYNENNPKLKETPVLATNHYRINLDNNVLDIADIRNSNFENKAQKIVEFNYDYSLASNVPNAINGRLTLKQITNKGKKGINLIPPYSFTYHKPNVKYDFDNSDLWGYIDGNVDAWSLSSIQTPTGGSIDIEYEEDSFYAEAAYIDSSAGYDKYNFYFSPEGNNQDSNYLNLSQITKTSNGITFDLSPLDIDYNLSSVFRVGDLISLDYFVLIRMGVNSTGFRKRSDVYTIANIESNQKVVLEKNSLTQYHHEFTNIPCIPPNGTNVLHSLPTGANKCIKNSLLLKGKSGLYTTTNPNGKNGGGLRVKNISINDGVNSYVTSYDYTNPINNEISGITSYEPFDDDKLVPYIEAIPSPNVLYGYVTVSQFGNNDLIPHKKTLYNFKTLKPYNFSLDPLSDDLFDMGDAFKVQRAQEPQHSYEKYNVFKNTIHDLTSSLGALLLVKSYNKKNQLISSTTNIYKEYDLLEDHSQGIYQSSFQTVKKIREYEYLYNNTGGVTRDNTKYYFNSSSVVEYPNVLENKTITQNGFSNTTYYDTYDFLTGQATETRTISSDGSEYISKIVPAYKISEYSDNTFGYSMGAMVDNSTNKNMLTQVAVNYTQMKQDDNSWKTIGADITTWNNDWLFIDYDGSAYDPANKTEEEKIWRKHQTFVWKGELDTDGTYKDYIGDDDNFNWQDSDNQTNASWINTSTVNLYDHYSMPLESEDINGNKASTKMGDDNTKVYAVANTGYTEMFFSGAEDLISGTNYFSGEVVKGSKAILSNIAHTGTYGLQVSKFDSAFIVQPDAGRYRASVWMYTGDEGNYINTRLTVGSKIITPNIYEVVTAGDWVQINFDVEQITDRDEIQLFSSDQRTIFDDFRLYPVQSSMTSYVYNDWDELTYIIGSNGLSTKYEYDAAGRLHKTYTEVIDTPQVKGGFKLSKEVNYNYTITAQNNNNNQLNLNLGVENPFVNTTILSANVTGGSNEYQYNWKVGTSSNNMNAAGTSQSVNITTYCGNGGRRYYSCTVTDKVTRETITRTGTHQRGGCSGNGNDDDDIPNPHELPQQ